MSPVWNTQRERRRTSARLEQFEKVKEQAATRLLPADLAQQVSELAEQERGRLLERIREIDDGLATLAGWLKTAAATERAAMTTIQPRSTRQHGPDGTVQEIAGRPVHIRGPEAVAAGEQVQRLQNWAERLRAERIARQSEVAEVARVLDMIEGGAALVAIGQMLRGWESVRRSPLIFALEPPTYTDRAGNELPPDLAAMPHGQGYPGEVATRDPVPASAKGRGRLRTGADEDVRSALADLGV
jgi:hypothetical protein